MRHQRELPCGGRGAFGWLSRQAQTACGLGLLAWCLGKSIQAFAKTQEAMDHEELEGALTEFWEEIFTTNLFA